MLDQILNLFFCRHRRYTWPQKCEDGTHTVACLDCSAQFVYDWEHMKIGKRLPSNVGREEVPHD